MASFQLSPTMVSSKLAALAFIRQFFADNGSSPSYGEIAFAIGRHRQTAKRAVRALERDGALVRSGARRGIVLTDTPRLMSMAEVVAVLRARGYVVDDDVYEPGAAPTGRCAPVTNQTLPVLRALAHIPGIDFEIGGMCDSNGRARS